jgi:cation:H+ antiporter
VILLVGYTVFLVLQSRKETKAIRDEYEQEYGDSGKSTWDCHWTVQILLILAGLTLLVLGSNWLVDAAVTFAKHLGVSELVIGLTIVAAGTSLPEVATSVMAAIKGERDIAVGNVVGSGTLNILCVLGASSAVAPEGLAVAPAILNFDIWVMIAVSVACLPIFFTGSLIARWEGALFLGYYIAYTTYLILSATRHDALAPFSLAMIGFFIPLTVINLIIGAWRHLHKTRA